MQTRRYALSAFIVLMGQALASVATADGYTICGKAHDPNSPFAWEQVSVRHDQLISARKLKSVAVALRAELLASAAQRDRNLTERFDQAASDLERIFPGFCSEFDVFKDEGGRNLAPTKYWLFRGRGRQAILLNEDCEDDARVAQMQEFRHLAGSFRELCAIALSASMQEGAARIEAIEARFDRYLFEGYPMFPWEALVNSWVLTPKHLAGGPPRNQIVLIHPSAGVVASTKSFADADPELALGIDLVGWIYYPERFDYRSWWGVAAMASIADDQGVGLGVALQWENFRLGAVYHDEDRDGKLFDDQLSIFLGVDLYNLVRDKHRKYESYLEKLRKLTNNGE